MIKLKNFQTAYLKDGSVFMNVMTLLAGTTIAQTIPILIAPVLTRMYTPENFGVYGLYVSMVSVAVTLATGCYEFAIMLPEEDKDAINICAVIVVINSIFTLLLWFIVCFFNYPIACLLGNSQLAVWLYLLPFSIFLAGMFQVFNYWCNRQKRFKSLARRTIAQSSVTAVTNLGLGFTRQGVGGLIFGYILGQFASNLLLGLEIKRENKGIATEITSRKMMEMARKYSRFPKFRITAQVLNTAALQLPIIFISMFFTGEIVGFYAIAHRFMNLPMSLLGNSVGQVFLQKAAEVRNNPKELKRITFTIFKRLFYIGIGPMAIIAGFGDYLFSFVFGEPWRAAGQYAQVLSVWILFVFISSPLSSIFTVLQKQKQDLFFEIILFSSRFLALYIGAAFFKDSYTAIMLFGVTGAVVWGGFCLYLLRIVNVSYKNIFCFSLPKLLFIYGLVIGIRYYC
ncbi:MAG: oligosaccharide flippase family protein [Pelosinus sp.]|nr:oligosaccharide flippase family protein [Pelosinus sp.]